VTRDDSEPQPIDFDHDDNMDDLKATPAKAESIINLSCSSEARRIVKVMRNSLEISNTLETSLDTAGSYISRQDLRC
jgi:hypothetical protein